jgi:hypothetical protein
MSVSASAKSMYDSPDKRFHPLGKRAYTQIAREDGKIYGLFTWYWAKALQQVQTGETWHDVFKRTYTPIVAERGQVQSPRM